jgi:hypothetical protein
MITPSFGLTATERVLPRMALDFTTASLDPRVTFTRAGNTATVVNSSGDVALINADLPRFDYDSITLACKGLLIEESRTNLALQSQAIDQVVWVKSNINTTGTPPYIDVAISPDGTQNADLVIPDTTFTALHKITQVGATVTAGATTTSSIYLKPGGYNFVLLRSGNASESAAFQVLVNLSNGTIGTPAAYGAGATVTGATITLLKNGWYRVTLTGAITGLLAYNQNIYVYESGVSAFSGNGTSGVYMWGAQVEVGAFATSYIPTVASQVTRTADVATMTGTNFSDWYSAGAGGVVTRVLPSTVSGTRPVLQFDDNTANEIIALRGNTTNPELSIVDGGAPQAQIDAGTIAANTIYNLGAAWATDNCAAAVNGGASVTDTTATIPTVTQARLGSDGANYLNGQLQTVRYWPQRIINAEVQAFSK